MSAAEAAVPAIPDVKKGKASKAKTAPKKRTVRSHPTFLEMITEAIVALKERTGSSQYAIQKFIEEKHQKNLPPTYKKLLLNHLKKLVAAEKLVKVKNSFKLAPTRSAAAKPAKKPVAVAAAAKPKAATKPKAAAATKPKPKAKPAAAKAKVAAKAKTVAKPAPKPKAKTAAKPAKVVKAKPVPKAKKPKSVKKSPAKKAKK